MLHINDLTFRIGGRVLLDHATAVVPTGHKAALIGRNGAGKSTLLKLIAGDLAPDGGEISLPAGARMGMVAQEAPSGPESLLDTVLAADVERAALLAEAETATDPHRIADIHARLADIHAHSAPARAASILAGLGFDSEAQARPCSDFSGGWRMRVALAAVLFAQPDLLILDEPTNHLDLEATLWLESYLKRYPRTILLVSHDRNLLNAIPTVTLHLENGKLTAYSGGYDQFERQRRANLERTAALAAKQAAERQRVQAFIDRFRYKASKARQAQSRMKMLERMEPIVSVAEEATPSFDFPSPDPLSPPLLTLEDVSVGYDGRAVLSRLDLRIDMDDRIALLGANGNGKSTLVKLLAGRLKPMTGEMRKSSKLKIGYFAQHQAEELALGLTAVQQAMALTPMATEQKVRGHLGRFGFPQAKADTRIGDMSGGEKARLLFALMAREAPHVVLLDEPTNHLDVDSREALVQAINAYEGAVILISHDPHLIELTADRLWLVADGSVRPFDGDMDDYRRLLLEQRRAERGGSKSDKAEDRGGVDRRQARRDAAESRAALAPLRKEAQRHEQAVAKLAAKKAEIEAKLADPALYDGPAAKLAELQIALGTVEKDLAAAEEAWLTVTEALEAAQAG